ncbi:MAG: HAD hydrolase-like protein [Sphaerochaetaceae bacterium]
MTVGSATSYYQKNFGAPDTLLEHFHWYDRTLDYDSFRPYPGVKAMLDYICESKRRNHLFTHRNNQVLEYLRHYQLLDYFTIKITGDDHLPFKPAPDGLLAIMRQGNILPDNLLMVGDRSIDIDSAWNATVHSLFFNSNKLPIPEHATYTITSYSEMKRYL